MIPPTHRPVSATTKLSPSRADTPRAAQNTVLSPMRLPVRSRYSRRPTRSSTSSRSSGKMVPSRSRRSSRDLAALAPRPQTAAALRFPKSSSSRNRQWLTSDCEVRGGRSRRRERPRNGWRGSLWCGWKVRGASEVKGTLWMGSWSGRRSHIRSDGRRRGS